MRVWLGVGAAAILLVAGLVVVLGSGSDSGPARPGGSVAGALADASPASAPFEGMTRTQVRVGDRTMSVVVADDLSERYQGLRQRHDIGSYDGMLFVFDAPTTTGFTMSTVPVPLDIGFYDARGRVVDRLRMRPCAHDESSCPLYRASGAFTYALETLADDLPAGRLRAA